MQNSKIRLLAGGLLLLITGGYVQAETLLPDQAWQQGKLANGFQWQILATPQRPSDRVEMRLLINTGSLVESAQQSGFSHFLSRLMLSQVGQQEGSLWQQSVDPQRPAPPAIVSYDSTLFHLSLPNNRSDLLKTALHTLAKNTGDLQVTSETVNATLGMDDPVKTWPDTQDNWWRYRLKGSTLLGHDPASNIIHPIDAEKLKSFYDKWYTPDAMTLIVVGNVDSRSLVEQLNKTFGELQGKREVPAPVPTLAALKPVPVSLMSNHVRQNKLSLTWDTPWQPIRESGALLNYWRADLAREALFWNVQQRLEKKNIKDINLSFDCGVLYQLAQCAINIESPTDKLNTNLELVGRELLAVKNNGLSQNEFNTLVTQKKKELSQLFITYARMDTDMLMEQRIRSQRNQVVDIAPENYQKLRQDFLDNLTVTVLNQDLRQQLSHDMSLILLQPQGEPEYNMKELQAVWDKVMMPKATPPATDDPKQEVTSVEAVSP
ncbi:pitrilysin family protein [uncultured Cedecea sp.]|uniref:M16 family metallopeptidase n=1 Tax=uncultured Cedecea sp. TaxID=988762 RepID=UPI00261DC1E3|nr:pitrilysin family protein [uncultured Cedecea sp.]